MSYFMVDIEADGRTPGDFSMIALGAIVVESQLSKRFYAELRPISDRFDEEALSICGFTREQTLNFENPKEIILRFTEFVKTSSIGRPIFISDNNGFDWMFVCWYLWHFANENPFGHSSQNLGSIYKGFMKSMKPNFKHLRRTSHTHNALDDAIGNAEALLQIQKLGLEIDLI